MFLFHACSLSFILDWCDWELTIWPLNLVAECIDAAPVEYNAVWRNVLYTVSFHLQLELHFEISLPTALLGSFVSIIKIIYFNNNLIFFTEQLRWED